jgi:hypothetical protein
LCQPLDTSSVTFPQLASGRRALSCAAVNDVLAGDELTSGDHVVETLRIRDYVLSILCLKNLTD